MTTREQKQLYARFSQYLKTLPRAKRKRMLAALWTRIVLKEGGAA